MDEQRASLHLDAENPWPGLAPYDEASQHFFHGREEETAELLRLIQLSPFVTLYGKSGLGKSSMLQAGLFPQLRAARYLPVYLRLDYSQFAERPPLEQAAARLQQELEHAGAVASPPEPGESLWAYLQRRDRPTWTADNYPLTPVLVFDQFEEVFSRGESPERVKSTLDSIADLVGNRLSANLAEDRQAVRRLNLQSVQYRVVLSFRSDFLAEVEGWEKAANLPKRESLHLTALSRETAIAAIDESGAAVLAPGVAAIIVDFVINRDSGTVSGQAAEVEPVLLSLCCYQLNARRPRPGRIDAALLKNAGTDILETFYEDALRGLGPHVPVFIEDHLIQGGHYRSNYPRAAALAGGALTAGELATLTQRKLLRVVARDVPRIELIHDRLVGIASKCRDRRLALEKQRKERERQARRERDARAARSRNWIAVVAAVLAVMSFSLIFFSMQARDQAHLARQAEERARQSSSEATALRLGAQSQGMLSGALGGSDERAYQLLMAARTLSSAPEMQGYAFDALVARQHLRSFSPTVLHDASGPRAVAFSSDGRWLATGNADGSIVLREGAEPWRELARTAAHVGLVRSVAFSRDGTRLLSAGSDGAVRQWRVEGLVPIGGAGRHDGAVNAAAYDHQVTRIVSAGEDGTVRLWDARSGAALGAPIELRTGPVYGVAFSRDDKRIAVATGAKQGGPPAMSRVSNLILLDAATRRETGSFYAHGDATIALAFSDDGHHVVTGGRDDLVRVRDLDSDGNTLVRMGGHADDVQSVAFSPDGQYVASGSQDKTVRLWRATDGSPVALPPDGHGAPVTSVAFSPDRRWLASAGEEGSLRFWPLDTAWSSARDTQLTTEELVAAQSLAIGSGGALRAFGMRDGSILLHDGGDSEHVLADAGEGAVGEASPCKQELPRPLGNSLGRSSSRNRMADPHAATSVAFGPQEQRIVSGHADGTLRLWDVNARRLQGPPLRVARCAISAVAWSANGRLLAAAAEDGAMLLAGDTGHVQRRLRFNGGEASALALSSDGIWLAYAGIDGTLALHDTRSAMQAWRLQGLRSPIISLAFGPDGKYLVSGHRDGTARLWDAVNGRPIGDPHGAHRRGVSAVVFSADGQRFLSATLDGAVRPWPAPDAWPGLMCAKLASNMSRQEWHRWVSVSAEIAYKCQCTGLPIAADEGLEKVSQESCHQ